jgi:hypothetical protein
MTRFLNTLSSGVILVSLVVLNACSSPEKPKKQVKSKISSDKLFSAIPSTVSGLKFNNRLKENYATRQNILGYEYFYNGGGVSIGDINNDGLQDILMTGNLVSNRLYLNKGNLEFEDITKKSGLSSKFWATGTTMADINGDGLLDIYVCNSGYHEPASRPNQLYINNGDLTFTESAKEYGVQDFNNSTQASFFDYDLDGDLDLFILNHSTFYEMPIPMVYEKIKDKNELKKVSNRLFRNNGNGKFSDVTEQAGLLNYGFGLGLTINDINGDGLSDIYVTNDYDVPDFMYINQGNGTFKDQIKLHTKHISWFGMGCDIGDINNDGAVEIGVVDMTPNDHFRSKTLMKSMNTDLAKYLIYEMKRQHQYMFNSLQLNNGKAIFSDIALLAGVAKTDWSWSALFSDLDNDGLKDYFVTNGFRKYFSDNDFQGKLNKMMNSESKVSRQEMDKLISEMPDVKIPNILYRNNGNLTFDNISKEAGLDKGTYSNGASIADLDNDGDLDIVINNIDQEMLLYRNNSESLSDNNFLQIKLEGDALNAKVKIFHNDDKIQFQELSATRGYQSSLPHLLHFGLGKSPKVDRIEITWADGTFQEMEGIKANQVLSVKKQAKGAKKEQQEDYLVYMTDHRYLGLDYVHKENSHDDYAIEVLIPHTQSRLGPFTAIGDINADGMDDIFLGGAKGQAGSIYVQKSYNKFTKWKSPALDKDKMAEDMDALFFDADGDKDQDLYVVSGGGSDFSLNDPLLQDRLYINDGKGNFRRSTKSLPTMISSGSKVKASDIDKDGDLDLFVGGRTVPGRYPVSPKSYLLENVNGTFKDITKKRGKELRQVGMVTDFVWSDFNGDDVEDLVVVGEWMPVKFFANIGGAFIDRSSMFKTDSLSGWWFSIEAADLDKDGDDDYILGNIGLNNKFHPSQKKPLHVYANDFDENGKFDIVLSSYYKGKEVPMRGRECSSEQMPVITEKFPNYESFAKASLEDVYGKEKLSEGLHLQARTFSSMVLMNDNGNFNAKELPIEAQLSSINRSLVTDLNQDGNLDLIVGGNLFNVEFETTRYDASNGAALIGDGKGNFKALTAQQSALHLPVDMKDMEWFGSKNSNKKQFIATNNSRYVQIGIVK